MAVHNKATFIARIRQAIAGIQGNFAKAKAIVLDGTPTKPTDAIATLQAAITAIDEAATAETAFHTAVAAQNAAIVAAETLLENLKTTVKGTLGSTPAVLDGFGFAETVPRKPTAATQAAAVQLRAETRAARGTKGKREKDAIKGTVPATPTTPAKPA
jgi:hypothetical protein